MQTPWGKSLHSSLSFGVKDVNRYIFHNINMVYFMHISFWLDLQKAPAPTCLFYVSFFVVF